ncbi:MAG: UbiD family decarboxylase [Thermodesulfobacteriota bacterium]|nr:UbiD family decarboxylase [Thermodesulfobacteriota bacterium]
MALKDIREFIELLKRNEEVQPIDMEVDWNLEIGAITRRCCEISAPAPLFNRIKDYPGARIFANPLAKWSRVALAMGMDAHASPGAIIKEYAHRSRSPIKPVLVSSGPCKEIKHIGDAVDLEALPAPLIHHGDGGRYLSTWHSIVNKDPDRDWVNWGMYRQMIHDKKTLGGLMIPSQDGPSIYYQRYEARNRPMEFATVIGSDPISALVSCNPVGFGVNEVDVAGGIRREPVELVKCETVDLLVPAHAEIILEGTVIPHERKEEGPFGEYTGYNAGGRDLRPVFHVQAITQRKDPILTMSNMGVPVDDCDIACAMGYSAAITRELNRKGFPIRDVAYVVPQCGATLVVVSTKVPYAGIARQIATAIWSDKSGMHFPYVIICDEDVDPTNLDQVMHALTTKCHPLNGIATISNMPGNPLLPFVTPHERQHVIAHCCLFDCTWPTDWPDKAIPSRVSFDANYPKEIQEKVISNWGNYGFKI